ncbi:SuhB inositol monophosphatase [gamma proteobacterium NOR5-3]|nr:SuhB inositol monophosphatase [gamma proteobacterium NOR5-3]
MTEAVLPLQSLCDLAVRAAREAGQFIQGTDRSQLQRQFKDTGSSAASQIVTDVDCESEALIRQRLQAASEQWDIAFVGEESSQTASGLTPERLLKPYHWCVDPLDGTLPFVEGKRGYAVSIALVDQSGAPLLGVVYDPVDSMLTHAITGEGAYLDGALFSRAKSESSSLMAFADASFASDKAYAETVGILNACAREFGLAGVEVLYGSGAVKNALQVLDCPAACYLKRPKPEDGGGSIWDFAATACIAAEAGAWVSDIHGRPLELNRPDSTFMNHKGVLYASNERIGQYLINSL